MIRIIMALIFIFLFNTGFVYAGFGDFLKKTTESIVDETIGKIIPVDVSEQKENANETPKAPGHDTNPVSKRTKPLSKRDKSIINPYYPFEWGDSLKVTQEKICGLGGLKGVAYVSGGFSLEEFCSSYVDPIHVDPNDPNEPMFTESNKSFYSDGAEFINENEYIVSGKGYNFEVSPIYIKGVKFTMTLGLITDDDNSTMMYKKNKDEMISYMYQGKKYYWGLILGNVSLTPCNSERSQYKTIKNELFNDLEKKCQSFDKCNSDTKLVISGKSKGTSFGFSPDSGMITYDGWTYLSNKHKGMYHAHIKKTLKNKKDSSSNL